MSAYSFERLSNGKVKMIKDGNTSFISGHARVDPESSFIRITSYEINGESFAISTTGDTITNNGDVLSGSVDAIAEVLATTTFFKSTGESSGSSVMLSDSVTLTHAQFLALTASTPFTIASVPVDKYANIINAVIEKNFTTGYTEGSAYLVIAQANDELQAGQSIYLTNGPDGIEIGSSGQKAVSEGTSPSSIQLFGGDIVFLNGAAEAMTDGHADNLLKITVYYTLADKLV